MSATYYTINEIADQLKVARITVYRWVLSGKLKTHKAGKQHRISQEQLDAFLKDKKS